MRERFLSLALTTGVVLAGAAAGPLPAAAQAAPGNASCSAGPISDGIYATTERQKKNKGADAAKAGKKGAAPSAEGKEVTEITLTWQCGGTAPGGAYIPEGYKMEVRGECPSGTCDLGTTVAMVGKGDGEYVAVLADDEVGFRQMHLSAKRKSVNLTVRTEVDGQRRPAQARYTLAKSN